MDFGILLDFTRRPGGTPEETFQESFELVDLADRHGILGAAPATHRAAGEAHL